MLVNLPFQDLDERENVQDPPPVVFHISWENYTQKVPENHDIRCFSHCFIVFPIEDYIQEPRGSDDATRWSFRAETQNQGRAQPPGPPGSPVRYVPPSYPAGGAMVG